MPQAALAAYFAKHPMPGLGLAVSGGGDSIALLRLAVEWAKGRTRLMAVTVDHGLRPEAAQEAHFVAQLCAQLGVPHTVLRWQGWDGTGNVQDQARRARFDLIAEWATGQGIVDVALAHTQDDQAETLVMRLARSAGVDGLAAMGVRQVKGVRFHRPLLPVRRADLRRVLHDLGQAWVEDPSNDDPNYERVRVRQRMGALADLGLTTEALADVADHMAQAREALDWAVHGFARQHLTMQGPDVQIDRAAFLPLPQELQRRLLAHVLTWLSAAAYPPRRLPLSQMMQAVRDQARMTLHGGVMTHRKGYIYLYREYAAVAETCANPDQVWDGRWSLTGPGQEVKIAPLGQAGLDQLPDRRALGRPAAAVMADPGVWNGGRLIAAPLSGYAQGWRITPSNGRLDCHSALLSH